MSGNVSCLEKRMILRGVFPTLEKVIVRRAAAQSSIVHAMNNPLGLVSFLQRLDFFLLLRLSFFT